MGRMKEIPAQSVHIVSVHGDEVKPMKVITGGGGGTIVGNKWNCKLSSNGTATSRQGTTAYGIYPNSISISNGTATITMYQRYNSTSTGTINGSYTARVYGVKVYDLIGG